MVPHPRNVRSREPRVVRPAGASSGPPADGVSSCALRHAYRFGASATPTPPPVTIELPPSEPARPPERRGPVPGPAATDADDPRSAVARRRPAGRRRWLLGSAILLPLLALTAWRAATRGELTSVARWSTLQLARVAQGQAAAHHGAQTGADGAEPGSTPHDIEHDGYEPLHGGVLIAPHGFVPEPDGSYDLLIHFHGDVGVVRESVEHAGINAALAIINLGVMSGVYRDAYSGPRLFDPLLDEINRAVAARGVRSPKVRRLALSAWSAGYGAVGSILRNLDDGSWPDAILVQDGIHAGWRAEAPGRMNPRPLVAFVDAAKRAAAGELLFSITHSEIKPPGFAGSGATAAYLLSAVGSRPAARDAMLEMPPHLALEAAAHAVAKRREKRMIPYTDTRVQGLHIRGFRGDTREHHMAHLLQMGATALPELAERWKRSAGQRDAQSASRSSSEQ